MRPLLTFSLALSWGVCTGQGFVRGQADDLAAGLLAQEKKYHSALAGFQGSIKQTHEILFPGKERRIETTERYLWNQKWKLFIWEGVEDGSCHAVNGKYAFELRKGKKGWFLNEVDLNLSDAAQIGWIKDNMDDGFPYGFDPYGLAGNGSLRKLATMPGFSITKQQRLDGADSQITKVWFNVSPAGPSAKPPGRIPIEGAGWFVLDKAGYWRVLAWELPFQSTKYGDPFVVIAKYGYRMEGDLPLLETIRLTYASYPGRKLIARGTRNFGFERRQPSESEFRLSAFGLPEPEFPRPPGWWTYPYAWFGMAALTLFLLAVLIARYRRMSSAEPAP